MVVKHNEESNDFPSLAALAAGLCTAAIAACVFYQPFDEITQPFDEVTQCIHKLISINEGATVQHIGGPHKYLLFVVITSGNMEYYVKFVKHFSFQQDCSSQKGFHPYDEVFTSFEYHDFTYTAFKIPNNYKTYLQMSSETTWQDLENKKLALAVLSIVENYHTNTNYYSDLDETSILIPTHDSDPSKIILANHYNLKCRTRGTEKYNKSPLLNQRQVVYSIGKLLINENDECYATMVNGSIAGRYTVAKAINCLNLNNNQILELFRSLKNALKNVINTVSSKKEQKVVSTVSYDIEQGMKVLNGKLFKKARLSIYIRIDATGTNSVVLKPIEIEFQKSETLPNRIFPNSDKFVKIYKFYPLPNDSSNRISIMEMKYYPNGDLKTFISSNKNWNDFEKEYFVMESSIQILEALIELAGQNYVHGDVKEENIFVDEFKSITNFKVVLADFTLAEKIYFTQGPPETSIETIFKEDVKRLSITIDKLLGSRKTREGGKYIEGCQTDMDNKSTLEEARDCIVSKQKAILLAEANLLTV